jgi:uncharacterized protein YhdP
MRVDGRVRVADNRFFDPSTEIELTGISGDLVYDRYGFSGSELSALFKNQPAVLNVEAGENKPYRFRTDVNGNFDVRDIIPGFLVEGYAALAQIEGNSDWQVSLIVDRPPGTESSAAMLQIFSDLKGCEMNLPPPLDKPAAEFWPLELRYPLTDDRRILEMELQDRVTLMFDIPQDLGSPQRAAIRLGGGPTALPPPGFVRINGQAQKLDLDGWVDVVVEGAQQGKGLGGLDLESGNLGADQLLFLDRLFDDIGLEFEAGDNNVKAAFAGENILGSVQFTGFSSGARSLSAEFERLVLEDPLSEGVAMDMDPADLPALHLYAKSLQYAGLELGETRIEAFPTSDGFQFEKVEAESEVMRMRATGDWSLQDGVQRSDFDIHMTAESLGEFLQSMDISSALEGGQTIVHFNAWWPGPPSSFGLSRLNGAVDFSVVDGMIANASPGAGRLLGLISVQALPRRLALDFSDVFDSGFTFDDANGTFMMENGTASTDDVVLNSSSASISLSGSTNLVDQQYDQLMTVRPGLGSTLPIIGAIAGGPGGAAAGLALQGLLHQQLGEATQVQYTITGAWDSPVIEPLVEQAANDKEDTPASKAPGSASNMNRMPR